MHEIKFLKEMYLLYLQASPSTGGPTIVPIFCFTEQQYAIGTKTIYRCHLLLKAVSAVRSQRKTLSTLCETTASQTPARCKGDRYTKGIRRDTCMLLRWWDANFSFWYITMEYHTRNNKQQSTHQIEQHTHRLCMLTAMLHRVS